MSLTLNLIVASSLPILSREIRLRASNRTQRACFIQSSPLKKLPDEFVLCSCNPRPCSEPTRAIQLSCSILHAHQLRVAQLSGRTADVVLHVRHRHIASRPSLILFLLNRLAHLDGVALYEFRMSFNLPWQPQTPSHRSNHNSPVRIIISNDFTMQSDLSCSRISRLPDSIVLNQRYTKKVDWDKSTLDMSFSTSIVNSASPSVEWTSDCDSRRVSVVSGVQNKPHKAHTLTHSRNNGSQNEKIRWRMIDITRKDRSAKQHLIWSSVYDLYFIAFPSDRKKIAEAEIAGQNQLSSSSIVIMVESLIQPISSVPLRRSDVGKHNSQSYAQAQESSDL